MCFPVLNCVLDLHQMFWCRNCTVEQLQKTHSIDCHHCMQYRGRATSVSDFVCECCLTEIVVYIVLQCRENVYGRCWMYPKRKCIHQTVYVYWPRATTDSASTLSIPTIVMDIVARAMSLLWFSDTNLRVVHFQYQQHFPQSEFGKLDNILILARVILRHKIFHRLYLKAGYKYSACYNYTPALHLSSIYFLATDDKKDLRKRSSLYFQKKILNQRCQYQGYENLYDCNYNSYKILIFMK